MGIFDILQRKGSVGSVVRWTYKNFTNLKNEKKEWTKSEILNHMFDIKAILLCPKMLKSD